MKRHNGLYSFEPLSIYVLTGTGKLETKEIFTEKMHCKDKGKSWLIVLILSVNEYWVLMKTANQLSLSILLPAQSKGAYIMIHDLEKWQRSDFRLKHYLFYRK